MSIFDVGELIRIFFKYPINYIPLLDQNTVGEKFIIGFLSRYKVLQFSTDKSRLEEKFYQIPDFFIEKKIQPEYINEFFEKAPIPVYNIFAKYIESWEKKQINENLKNFLYTETPFLSEIKKEENSNVDNIDKEKCEILERILSSIPLPLFAINRNGISVFYNQLFIKQILEKGPFKKTLALAETYFKEVIERTIAENIKKNLDIDNIQIFNKELNHKMIISNIFNNNEVVGYLIIFFNDSDQENLISFVEGHLKNKKTYDEILDLIEIKIINEFLKRNHNNISHTADFLNINRTTLQNKIKRLNISSNGLNPMQEKETSKNISKKTTKKKTNKRKDN